MEFLSLTGSCTGWSESTHVKMPYRWKSYAMAQLVKQILQWYVPQWFDCRLPGCGGFTVYFPAERRELHRVAICLYTDSFLEKADYRVFCCACVFL